MPNCCDPEASDLCQEAINDDEAFHPSCTLVLFGSTVVAYTIYQTAEWLLKTHNEWFHHQCRPSLPVPTEDDPGPKPLLREEVSKYSRLKKLAQSVCLHRNQAQGVPVSVVGAQDIDSLDLANPSQRSTFSKCFQRAAQYFCCCFYLCSLRDDPEEIEPEEIEQYERSRKLAQYEQSKKIEQLEQRRMIEQLEQSRMIEQLEQSRKIQQLEQSRQIERSDQCRQIERSDQCRQMESSDRCRQIERNDQRRQIGRNDQRRQIGRNDQSREIVEEGEVTIIPFEQKETRTQGAKEEDPQPPRRRNSARAVTTTTTTTAAQQSLRTTRTDEMWKDSVDLTMRRLVLSVAGGTIVALTMFRGGTARWSIIALGAGLGLGLSLRDASDLLHESRDPV